ncbi:hypothetical protein D3C73_1375190 [compost metagenome]
MGIAFEMLVFPPERFAGTRLFFRRSVSPFQLLVDLLLDQILQNILQHLFPFMSKRRVPEIVGNRRAFHHFRIDDQSGVFRSLRRDLRVCADQAARRLAGDLGHLERMG